MQSLNQEAGNVSHLKQQLKREVARYTELELKVSTTVVIYFGNWNIFLDMWNNRKFQYFSCKNSKKSTQRN